MSISFLYILLGGLFDPVSGAVVSGTVRDISGATVSQALVSFILASDTTIAFHGRTDQQGNYTIDIDENAAVDQDNGRTDSPLNITLFQNYPNPFNPVTCISFQVDTDMPVFLAITNVLGQTVRVLVNKKMNVGTHTVFWDGRDESGRGVGAGLYICLMEAGGNVFSRKVILSDGTTGQQGANFPISKSMNRFLTSENMNVYNVVITGKGILPFTVNGISVTGDINLDFTVERAPAKHPVLDKSVTLDGGSQGDDAAYGFIFDKDGYMYVTGFVTVSGEDRNIWLAKYDAELNLMVSKTVNGSANGEDTGYTFALDDSSNLFIIGYITETGEDHNIWIGKFDTDLHLLAETDVAGPVAGEEDKGYGICLDEFGILYCAGTLTEPDQGYNIWLAKYDTDLNPIDHITRDGPLHGEDVAYVMVMDDLGYLYITGVYTELAGNENVWIGIYNRDLQLQNDTTVNGPANAYDSGIGIAYRPNGVYVSGFLTDTSEGGNIWIARYNLID